MHRHSTSRSPRSPVQGPAGPALRSRTVDNTRELPLRKLYVGQDPHIDSIFCQKCGEIPINPRECSTCGGLTCLKCSMTRAGSLGPQRKTATS